MKSKWFIVGLSPVLALSVVITSCSVGKKAKVENVNSAVADKLATQGRTTEAAEMYSRIGELLLIPEGIQYADEMFDKALAINPNDGKANFYSAITKPLMAAQGFITRMEPIVDANGSANLIKLKDAIDELRLPELIKFANELPAGKKQFESYYDVQRAVRTELLPAVAASVDKVAKLKAPLKLNINLSRLGLRSKNPKYNYTTEYSYENTYCQKGEWNQTTHNWECTSTITERNFYTTWTSNYDPTPTEYNLDDADLTIIRSAAQGALNSLRINTAYSIKGLEHLIKKWEAYERVHGKMNARSAVKLINAYSELGTLESDNLLSDVSKSAADTAKNMLDLATLQNDLCNNPARQYGSNLFTQICIIGSDLKNLQVLSDLLAGPKKVEFGGDNLTILMDVNAILYNPPRDLHALLPNAFDVYGNVSTLQDPTVGGLFPNGDLIEKLKANGTIKQGW